MKRTVSQFAASVRASRGESALLDAGLGNSVFSGMSAFQIRSCTRERERVYLIVRSHVDVERRASKRETFKVGYYSGGLGTARLDGDRVVKNGCPREGGRWRENRSGPGFNLPEFLEVWEPRSGSGGPAPGGKHFTSKPREGILG